MVPARRRPPTSLSPRWPLVRLFTQWTPHCMQAVSLEAYLLTLDSPRSLSVSALQHGEPARAAVAPLVPGEAISHLLGRFELSGFDAPSAPPDDVRRSSRTPEPSVAPSEEEMLARRLAALLQPPLEALCAPQGVLDWPAPLLPYQREGIAALLSRHELLLADDMGLGKAQPLDAQILTPSGWKPVKDITPGDAVIGQNGQACRVIGVYPQGLMQTLRVTFSDGAQAECTDDHLWQVQTPSRKWQGAKPRVKTLREIRQRLRDKSGNYQHFIPIVGPVEFEEAENLPLPPYLLGALLGDGGLRHRVMFSTSDMEMVSRIGNLLPGGCTIVRSTRYDWRISGTGSGKPNPVLSALRQLGLMGKGSADKFVPDCFKFASTATRLAVLQGLMDTDGWVTKDGTVGFSSASQRLAEDVVFLVRSLGGIARLTIKPRKGGLPAYNLTIAMPQGVLPFALARKAEAYRPRPKYPPARAIVSIEPVGLKLCQCIAVDAPDRLYVTDDFVVTHNTIQAIAALRILYFRRAVESALLVCPASLMTQWQRELARWAPELRVVSLAGKPAERGSLWQIPAHVRLVSYETLRADVMDLRDSPVLRGKWGVVILDEASRIKNRGSGIAIACRRIPRERRWALTGTPLENRIDDLISLLEFLTGEPNRPARVPQTPAALRAKLQHLQLRRKKAEVLTDLPPKQVNERILDLSPAQRAAYDLAEREGIVRLTESGASVTVTHVLELISRLKQLCNFDPVSGESAKLADIAQRLATLVAEGHRALVFSQFTDDTYGVGRVVAALKDFHPLSLTGSLSPGQRASVVDRFLRDARHKALILSLRAGGVGLNLQAASYVFHLDRWWNPAIEEQADSRAHRMGQPYPVTVFRYICAGTIEERIDAKLQEKRRLFQDIVDDVSLDLGAALSEEELFGLFGLAAPRHRQSDTTATKQGETFEAMSGQAFEEWIAVRLAQLGFAVESTPASRDGGIDLIASRLDSLRIETRLLIQCKNHRDPVGVAVIREIRGAIPDRSAGIIPIVACPGGFSTDAMDFASRFGIRLWGRNELEQLDQQTFQGPLR